MALSDGLGIQALVQSYDKKAISQAFTEIASQLNKSVDDLNDDLNKIKIDKDVVNNLVNQLKALPEEVRKKAQGMSFDLFSDLINADGAEEKIDEAFKTFTNKIQSFVKLRDQIGNDEIIIKADYSQIDELIGKTERLLELQKELDKWQSGKSRTKKSINADISSVESEIKSGISNLNVSGGQVGVGVNVDNEALAELDKKIKETEESLKSAREEAEKYGGSLDVLKKKIDQTYNKSIDKDTQKNADNFREAVQNYIKAGGSQKDLDKDYLSWYKLSGGSWPKNFIPLNQIANESEKAQQKVQELENALDNLYSQREALSKGIGSNVISSEIDAEKLKEQEQEINKIKESLTKTESQLEQVNQKYAEQNNLVSELENKLKALEGINNPKVIETDEYKNIVSELEIAKNKASEFQNEMNKLRQTVEVLKSSLSSYNTGDVVPRQDLENANHIIDNLSNKINELETSLTETKNKFTLLSEEVTKLQQDKSDLSGQLAQQKEINAAQQEQISNQSKIQAELEKTKNKLNELLTTIAKLQDIQKNAISTIENYGEIEEFKKASKIVGYNEGIDTPENFVNFDYLEKAKQKVQELGKEYDKLDVKAAVYYNQYLQNGGTEKIFDANGKDVSNELISVYTEMSNLINQTGDISIETAQKILRSVNSQIYSLNEEKKALQNKNKELEKAVKLEEKAAKAKKENQQVQQEQAKISTAKRTSISQEQFRKDMEREQAKAQSNIDNTTGKGTSQVDSSSIVSEQQALNNLEQAINSVTAALVQKVKATQAGEVQTDLSVNQEIAKLQELEDKLTELKTKFENGLSLNVNSANINAKEALKNPDGVITNPEIDVDLKPTVDADKFKSDAERLLAFVDVNTKVDLEVGEVKADNASKKESKNNIYSELSNNIIKDYNIKGKEVKNKIQELSKSLYNNIDLIRPPEKSSDDFGNTFEELGKVIADNANIIQKKTGIYEEFFNYIKGLSSIKIPNVVRTDLGDDWDVLRKTYASKFSTTKGIELDSIYQEMSSQFKDLFSGTSDQTQQFKEIINNIRAYRKDTSKTIIPLSNDDIDQIYSDLLNRLQEMRDKLEVELGNSVKNKETLNNEIQIQPLINNQEWLDAIDDILKLIGTKKVPIIPDTSGPEWTNFNNFIDEISKKVINLNINTDVKNDSDSSKSASSTNSSNVSNNSGSSTSASNNNSDNKSNKKQQEYDDAEMKRRAKEIREATDILLQNLREQRTTTAEYSEMFDSHRNLVETRFKEIGYDDDIGGFKTSVWNTHFDKAGNRTYSANVDSYNFSKEDQTQVNILLEQQRKLVTEIRDVRSQILQLERMDTGDDENNQKISETIKLLEERRDTLTNEYNRNDDILSQFDAYIDKNKELNKLAKIRDKADQNDISSAYADLNNVFQEYARNERQIAKNNIAGISNKDAGTIEKRIQLLQKLKNIQDQIVNEGLSDPVKDTEYSARNKELEENIKLLYSQAQAQKEARENSQSVRKSSSTTISSDENLTRLNSLYDQQLATIKEINALEAIDNDNRSVEQNARLTQLTDELLNIHKQIDVELDSEYKKTTKIQQALDEMVKTRDKVNTEGTQSVNANQFSLTGRETDISVAYDEANRVNTALNRTSTLMEEMSQKTRIIGDNFQRPFDVASDEIDRFNKRLASGSMSLSSYDKAVNRTVSGLRSIVDVLDKDATEEEGIEAIQRYIRGLANGGDVTFSEPQVKGAVTTLTAEFKNLDGQLQRVKVSYNDVNKQVVDMSKSGVKSVSSFSKFIDELGAKFRNLSTYLLSFVGFYEIWAGIQQGFTYVRELDSALTEMRKVSDETTESLREFQEVSFDIADSVGSTAKEIQNSTADFMRLGYSLQEASQLAEDANIYANVGDMEIDEATEHMISSIKAWGSEFESEVEASEAIIDRYNEIGM